MMEQLVRPNVYVGLRLPSDLYTIVEVKPNTTIHIGKYGHFQSNDILGRPYYLTFEVLEKSQEDTSQKNALRIVPASELYAHIQEDDSSTPSEIDGDNTGKLDDGVHYDIVGEDGQVIMRTNRHTVDDSSSQLLTMQEIEELKASSKGSGKELIAKILDSHSALDQKTAFALAKYTLRKTRKYLRRFTVLPVDVSLLVKWTLHREPTKTLELREDTLALIGSFSNIHYTPPDLTLPEMDQCDRVGGGRWLVVDETAGLVTAYVAEQMGLLDSSETSDTPSKIRSATAPTIRQETGKVDQTIVPKSEDAATEDEDIPCTTDRLQSPKSHLPSNHNTITAIHSLHQPNLSLLRYFSFDPHSPPPDHPLTKHLKTLSWLQLLDPSADSAYTEPPYASPEELSTWKSAKRAGHLRKRRRWERTKFIIDETRAGGFDGLIVASVMKPTSILHHLVPLLRGSAQVVVYSPHVEPLAELADFYSTARKTAFLENEDAAAGIPSEDFPINPRLLLAPTIHTTRAKPWQSLPGRTHPLMTGRGGSDGFVFSATRVIPAEGKVDARGKFNRRKKVSETLVDGSTNEGDGSDMEVSATVSNPANIA